MNLPPPLIRYFIPLLSLLLLLNGIECEEKAKIKVSDLKADALKDEFMKLLDIYLLDNKCQLARFGYSQDFYKIGIDSKEGETFADLLVPENSCPRKTHAMLVASEGEQYYYAYFDEKGKLYINTYKIPFAGDPRIIEAKKDIDVSGLKDLSNCFEDLGSFYCVALRPDEDDEISSTFKLLRFAKKSSNFFELVGILNFEIRHGEMPRNILQDSQTGEIAIIYQDFDGHEGQSFDVRSIFQLGQRGKLVRANYPVHQTLGIASHRGYRFFVVYPKHSAGNQQKPKTFTFYRAPIDFPIANKEVDGTDWDGLAGRRARRIKMFFKNRIPDHFQLARFTAQRCVRIMKKTAACIRDLESVGDIRIALIVVVVVLICIFIALVILLLVYLICCVKTKRRRRKKRKHRKHRKHRKAHTEKSSKPNEEEVEVEPGKPEEEEEKPEENKVVQKLKEFGGVDYSSSSSEDLEHSQAYFSARDKFDTNVSTAANASNTPDGGGVATAPNYENIGPSAAGDPASVGDQATGATPEEHDMQDKYGAKPSGPRSVYMKPKKKKK